MTDRFTLARLENPAKYLWKLAQSRAKKQGIEFSIDVDDVQIPTHCPVLGFELEHAIGKGWSASRERSPSLDRIRPELGYVKGNVQVISTRANCMKNSATPEQLLTFADWVFRTYR